MAEHPEAQIEPGLSEAVRRILVFASDHASGLGHGFVTCQHILYALSQQSSGLLAAALESLNVEVIDLEKLLVDNAPVHDRIYEMPLEFSDEVVRVLKRAALVARRSSEEIIEPDHLLNALLSEPSSADELLDRVGTNSADVRAQWITLQKTHPYLRRRPVTEIRLTTESAEILAVAQDNARQLGGHEVSSVHLLYALVTSTGKLGQFFSRRIGLNGQEISRQISDDSEIVRPQHNRLPLANDLQAVIGCAFGTAWKRGHALITPAHLAMGLARAPRHNAHDLLADLGVSQSDLIDALEDVMPPAVTR